MPADPTFNQLLTTLFESQIGLAQASEAIKKLTEEKKDLEEKLAKLEEKPKE